MAPPTSTVVSRWAISTRNRPNGWPSSAKTAPSWPLFHVGHPNERYVFHDAQSYLPCVHQDAANFDASRSHGPSLGLVLVSNACPQCWQRPKHPDHRFCSVSCDKAAARLAPRLNWLPENHEMYMNVATRFLECWKTEWAPLPKVLAVYLITWSETYKRAFERYRDAVEARQQFRGEGRSPGNEQKRFRGTTRACSLGERGNMVPCRIKECWTCETIRAGFGPHLERKRNVPLDGPGIRLGAGIYTSHTSSKADQYADNVYDPSSRIKAMLVCRVVIGKAYDTRYEDHTFRSPPLGYDCVCAKPGCDFSDDEYVVYDADAIRAAYLILYEKAPDS